MIGIEIGIEPPVLDRALGAFMGLFVGDALGVPLEFEERDRHPPVTDMIGGGWLGLDPGVWTDDGALALALGKSLIASRGRVDSRQLANEFVGYMNEGKHHPSGRCIDIGSTTSAALLAFLVSGDPRGPTDDCRAGNGSLMRVAPVALVTNDEARAGRLAREQSKVTHAAKACLDACEAVARMMVVGIETGDRDRALDACAERRFMHPDVEALSKGAWGTLERREVPSSGFVVDTLCAALWSVGATQTFEDAVAASVNLGGDSDTVGCVTGMLAGSIYGVSLIPDRWLAPLAWRERLEQTARDLLALRESRT